MLQSLICKICSNGCKITAVQSDSAILISGNKCKKGYKLLKGKILKENPSALFDKEEKSKTLPKNPEKMLSLWDISFSRNLQGQMIQGSPERSLFRTIIEDTSGKRFILEEITEAKSKEKIAKRLYKLKKAGLRTITYCKGTNDSFVQKRKGRFWLCQEFLPHTPLQRATYWKSDKSGVEVASFLLQLRDASHSIKKKKRDHFSLVTYINDICNIVKKQDKETYRKLQPILSILKEHLFPIYDTLPELFSHGDPHPLNMIWRENHIVAVIDWEFSGFKPRLYDVSLILGCVGSEDETSLSAGFVRSFLNELFQKNYLSDREWHYLPLFTVAQRFAWLSEWLRREDTEMVEFELFYMRHLLQWQPEHM